jgi:hypothetical protein
MTVTAPKFDETDLDVCEICIHLLMNGEYNDGTDRAERASDGMVTKWGDDARHITPVGTELGHFMSECDGCGNPDHGDRWRAVLMIPVAA